MQFRAWSRGRGTEEPPSSTPSFLCGHKPTGTSQGRRSACSRQDWCKNRSRQGLHPSGLDEDFPPRKFVPEVTRDLLSVVLGSQGVTPGAPSDGEHHFDALGLAGLDIGAYFLALMAGAVVREVDLRGPAIAE